MADAPPRVADDRHRLVTGLHRCADVLCRSDVALRHGNLAQAARTIAASQVVEQIRDAVAPIERAA